MKGKDCRYGGRRAKPRMTGARKWDQSVCDTSHAYELIGAQFQILFMLLKDEIRHNQEELRLGSSRSRRLTLGSGRAHEPVRFAQGVAQSGSAAA
jgi:hypothetical protein